MYPEFKMSTSIFSVDMLATDLHESKGTRFHSGEESKVNSDFPNKNVVSYEAQELAFDCGASMRRILSY